MGAGEVNEACMIVMGGYCLAQETIEALTTTISNNTDSAGGRTCNNCCLLLDILAWTPSISYRHGNPVKETDRILPKTNQYMCDSKVDGKTK